MEAAVEGGTTNVRRSPKKRSSLSKEDSVLLRASYREYVK